VKQSFVAFVTALITLFCEPAYSQITFEYGHSYSTFFSRTTVNQYDRNYQKVGEFEVGKQTRGLTFGSDGLLYVAAHNTGPDRFELYGYDESGNIRATFTNNMPSVGNNVFYGKLVSDDNYLFVGGTAGITRYELGGPDVGTMIVAGDGRDIELLPNGNLLHASSFGVREITVDGSLVREFTLNGGTFFNVNAVEYDPIGNDVFFANHTGGSIIRFDFDTGDVEDIVSFANPVDMHLTADGELLVGSWTGPAARFNRDLQYLGDIGEMHRMFITQYSIPEPTTGALYSLAGLAMTFVRRRK
jgi:hypothetical protein